MSTHGSQLERSISRLPQTDYATARASGDQYRRIVSASRSVLNATTTFEDDAGYDNGSDVKSDLWATTSDNSGSMDPMYNFQDAGYFWLWALGGYAVSGAGPYTHTFTPQNMNTSRQLPVRTLLEKWGGLNLRMVPSVYCSGLTFSFGKSGRCQLDASLIGSGKYLDNPASYTSPTLTADREYGYGGQGYFSLDNKVGTFQVETATLAAAGALTAGFIAVTVTAAGMSGSPLTIQVPTTAGWTVNQGAAAVRNYLRNDPRVSSFFDISGTAAAIVLTAKTTAANDATLNVATTNGSPTATITPAPTSADTTAGVAGDTEVISCALESGQVALDNPLATDGYRQCSPYVLAGIPESGTTRNEALVGARSLKLTFSARLLAGSKLRQFMLNGTPLRFKHIIRGKDGNNHSQTILHTASRVIVATEEPESADGFFGISGEVDLMSDPTVSAGHIPFSVVIINDVPSYVT